MREIVFRGKYIQRCLQKHASACGFRRRYSAKCYEWIEQEDHGYKFKSYAVIPEECPKCHATMTAVVWEEGDKDGRTENERD